MCCETHLFPRRDGLVGSDDGPFDPFNLLPRFEEAQPDNWGVDLDQPTGRPGERAVDLAANIGGEPRTIFINYQSDLIFLATSPRFGRTGATIYRELMLLAASPIASEVENLAILIGDDMGSVWGDELNPQALPWLLRRLRSLRRCFLVYAGINQLYDGPPGTFDTGDRTSWGFMPIEIERQGAAWPWFQLEYEDVLEPVLSQVEQAVREAGRDNLDVQLVIDPDFDYIHWQDHAVYRRHVLTGNLW
ncbi:hypothetical protein QBC47DRAFT_460577 [Echria macrotheca]|uniref:Uncharacterized protein n=1 Tax=Echria macrotheca TaxID=438768 RepID=A0AAJ0BC72_9PEZI|nr:hypothetical protein QBC47DRAFT_460577 [Echria macrotheca]